MCPDMVLKIHSVKILWVLGSVNSYILTNFIAIVILYQHLYLSFENLLCICTQLPIWLFHFGNLLVFKILCLPNWESDLISTHTQNASNLCLPWLSSSCPSQKLLLVINSLLTSYLNYCPPHHLLNSSSFILVTKIFMSVAFQKEYINIDVINEWIVIICSFWLSSLLI